MGWSVTTAVDHASRSMSVREATAYETAQAEREKMESILYPVAFWCRFCSVTLEAGRHV